MITDFDGNDRIDLSAIDARSGTAGNQAFTFLGTSAFTGTAGQLHYSQVGGNTLVSGDTNGDQVADFAVQLSGVPRPERRRLPVVRDTTRQRRLLSSCCDRDGEARQRKPAGLFNLWI